MVRRITHSLVKALRQVREFAGLSDAALLEVVGASVNLFFPAGAVVFRKGATSDGLYVVLSGRVIVADEPGGPEVAQIGPGDYFGEQSLLLETTRSHSVAAVQDAEILVLPASSFQRLLEGNPVLAGQVEDKLRARLAATDGPGSAGQGPAAG
ncbi:MAG: cyclic nucleotide-binding domain-containing protein [Egibacteraceae bacterium]